MKNTDANKELAIVCGTLGITVNQLEREYPGIVSGLAGEKSKEQEGEQ